MPTPINTERYNSLKSTTVKPVYSVRSDRR